MSQSVGVVILDYDQIEVTTRCLRSIADNTTVPEHVVVVENGSKAIPKRNLNRLRSSLQLSVLRPSDNLGCAGGRNLGLNFLATNTDLDRFMILDNDTILPTEFFTLLAEIEQEPLAVVAPVISSLQDGNRIAGGYVEPNGKTRQIEFDPAVHDEPFTVDWAPGACQIIPREAWNRIGEYDCWMDFLFEDTDWCLRLADHGGRVIIQPTLQLDHEESHSLGGAGSPARLRYWARNGIVFRVHSANAGTRETISWMKRELARGVVDISSGERKRALFRFWGLSEGVVETIRRDLYDGTSNRPADRDTRDSSRSVVAIPTD